MDELLERASALAREYLDGVAGRPVGVPVDPGELRAGLGGPMPERGEDPVRLIEALARDVEPGLVATVGPRYFGFVIGGSLPVTVATAWLSAAWDQNAGDYASSPAASVDRGGRWTAGWWTSSACPPGRAWGFVTGATMANFTALAAGRHAVLRDVGWDVESTGLFGAPPINVIVGAVAHFDGLRCAPDARPGG